MFYNTHVNIIYIYIQGKLLLLVDGAHCVVDHRKPADGLQEVCLGSSKHHREKCWKYEVMLWQQQANWITDVSDVSFQVFYKNDPISIKIAPLRPAPGYLNNEIQPAAAPRCSSNH